MGQETRTIVIYSRQHLLQQTQEEKAASKSVSTAELEEILSIRFQEFICFYLFIFRRASAPDFQNLIGTSHKLEDQQCSKKRYMVYLKDYSQTPLQDLNTCCRFRAWLHVASFLEPPLGFSQLLSAQIYGTCLQEHANKGAMLILLLLSLTALPSLNLFSSEPKPWCILKHSQNLCFNAFFPLPECK